MEKQPTRRQKKENRSTEYQERVYKIEKHGFTIIQQIDGPKHDADSFTYYVHKDGECIHKGECYKSKWNALEFAESLILETNISDTINTVRCNSLDGITTVTNYRKLEEGETIESNKLVTLSEEGKQYDVLLVGNMQTITKADWDKVLGAQQILYNIGLKIIVTNFAVDLDDNNGHSKLSNKTITGYNGYPLGYKPRY